MALSHSQSGIWLTEINSLQNLECIGAQNPEDNWRFLKTERSRNRIEFLLPAHSSCFLWNLRCFFGKTTVPFPTGYDPSSKIRSRPGQRRSHHRTWVGPGAFEFLSRNPLMIVVNIRKELKTSEPDSCKGWRCSYRQFYANQSSVHEIFKFSGCYLSITQFAWSRLKSNLNVMQKSRKEHSWREIAPTVFPSRNKSQAFAG